MAWKRPVRGINGVERMDGKVWPDSTPVERSWPSRVWKRMYECKKAKGPHPWRFQHVSGSRWYTLRSIGDMPKPWFNWWASWRCDACGKLGSEWNKCRKEFDPYRHTIYEGI